MSTPWPAHPSAPWPLSPPRQRHVGRRRQWPDRGLLRRKTAGGFNEGSQTWVEPGRSTLWTGWCSIEASEAANPVDVAEQQVSVQPFRIKVPLDVIDVRPDDEFLATVTDDPYLLNRPLVIVRVAADSHGLARVLYATDDQG